MEAAAAHGQVASLYVFFSGGASSCLELSTDAILFLPVMIQMKMVDFRIRGIAFKLEKIRRLTAYHAFSQHAPANPDQEPQK